MATSKKSLEAMRRTPKNVRFADLLKLCEEHLARPANAEPAMLSSTGCGKTRSGGRPGIYPWQKGRRIDSGFSP
jgi:hypothetical protein